MKTRLTSIILLGSVALSASHVTALADSAPSTDKAQALAADVSKAIQAKEKWATGIGYPHSLVINEVAKSVLITVDAASVPRATEEAALKNVLASNPTPVGEAAVKIVQGQIANDQ